MKLADESQICYVVMRESCSTNAGEEWDCNHIPCAVFTDLLTAENTVEAYNQKFKDEGIEGYNFYLSCTALYNDE